MEKQKHLLILGGGHAGSSAALAAANHLASLKNTENVRITLLDQSPNLTIRPRLYEYELEDTQVPLKNFLAPIGINILTGTITNIDFINQQVLYNYSNKSEAIKYDVLVLALGSQLVQTGIPGINLAHNIDCFAAASQCRQALIQHLRNNANKPCRIAILGGGITGIELATELPLTVKKIAQQYKIKCIEPVIYLIDRHDAAKNLGLNDDAPINEALALAKINCINHASINEINDGKVIYNDTNILEADIIVSTLGLRANNLTKQFTLEKDQLGRLYVNEYLQLQEYPNCFSAGDIAHAHPDAKHDPVMSCQQARPQGRYAGYNAISLLLDLPFMAYSQPNYVTCIDLGEFGAIYTEGWNRKLIKSGAEAKKVKQHINQDRIYPPKTTDIHELLKAGVLEFTAPTASINQAKMQE